MTDDLLHFFRKLVLDRSGLALSKDKDYLLKARLEPVARSSGLGAVEALLCKVRMEPNGPLARQAIDAMCTHESFFFRDGTPFEQLKDTVLPRLAEARRDRGRIRIWSAACSSGQEPYSLAMLMEEERSRLGGIKVDIVATDFSAPILEKARSGVYSDFEVARGLSEARKQRWFQRFEQSWRIRAELRSMIDFRQHNILDGVAGLGRFDLILCRNVLIYFDRPTKVWALEQMARALEPDGRLILGSAETVVGLSTPFQPGLGLRGVFEARAANAGAIA